MRTVKEVMTREVEIARPEMTVQQAAEKMRQLDIGSLPVCENNLVVGIITDRDITVRATASGRASTATTVADVMTRGAHTVSEDAALDVAETLMHDLQLRRLPVVNERREIVGYLTQAQIARAEDAGQAGRVLKGISQPHPPAPMATYPRETRRKTG